MPKFYPNSSVTNNEIARKIHDQIKNGKSTTLDVSNRGEFLQLVEALKILMDIKHCLFGVSITAHQYYELLQSKYNQIEYPEFWI